MQSSLRGKIIKKICENCGKEFRIGYSWKTQRFCNLKCSSEFHKKNKFHRGKENPLFKNGKTISHYGYILLCINALPEDDRILARKMIPENFHQIPEHRFVMAKFLGRPLKKEEIVHHLNGKRSDNRIENLKLLTRENHCSGHEIICPHCKKSFVV